LRRVAAVKIIIRRLVSNAECRCPPIRVHSTIDPMLFAGGKTVKEIAELAIKQAADLAKGKDVEANVRAPHGLRPSPNKDHADG
jgi:hypothetical protein